MSEFIMIAGERREVPADVVAQGRDAVEAWHRAQLAPAKAAKGQAATTTTSTPTEG